MKVLAVVLLLAVMIPMSHQDLFRKCFAKYAIGLALPPTLENHCSVIKNTSNCLGMDATETGPLLELMRFYVLEHAMFDICTNLCSPYDYTYTKDALLFTDVIKKYGKYSVENVCSEDDIPLNCARQVHLSAKGYYKKVKSLKQLLCDDPRNLVKFYKTKASEMKCKSKILDAFISTLRHVVPALNNEIMKRLHISCP